MDVIPENVRIKTGVKTENVQCELENAEGGALIGLLDTTEYSAPIEGTNDWQPMNLCSILKIEKKSK